MNNMDWMKRSFLGLFALLVLASTGCVSAPISETESVPFPTSTKEMVPSPSLEPTPSLEIIDDLPPEAPTEEIPATEESAVIAVAGDDGKVYLGATVLLDIAGEAPGCFDDIPAEITYSPTNESFVVIPFCIEGDNQAFYFRADGTGKQQITGPWDYLNYLNYEWSPDGKYFIYQRINSCCVSLSEIPPDAPPEGLVQFDVETGEKTLIATPEPPDSLFRVVNVDSYDVLNIRSGPGTEHPIVGSIPPDGRGIRITGEPEIVGETVWVPILYEGIAGWVNSAYLIAE